MSNAITQDEDFILLLQDELGLDVGLPDLDRSLDEIGGWDSVHLLRLVGSLERATGRRVPVVELLQATTFREIRAVVGR